jgi:hypothetical protein
MGVTEQAASGSLSIDGYDGFRMRKHATTGGRFLAPGAVAILAAFKAGLNICGSQGTDSDAAMSAFALRALEGRRWICHARVE